jgi:predicted secreted protein
MSVMHGPAERWQLKRQDDNGNQYVMGTFGLKEQAEDRMAHYQNKGHKQTYWVERIEGK